MVLVSSAAAYEVVRLHIKHHAEERDLACALCAFEVARSGQPPDAMVVALDAEREVCAALAEVIMECYNEHPEDCGCTGEARAYPFDIARRIRGRKGR